MDTTRESALAALAAVEVDLQAQAEVDNDPESEADVSEQVAAVVAEMATQVELRLWTVLVPDECGNPWDAGLSVFVSHEEAAAFLREIAAEAEWTVDVAKDGLEYAMNADFVCATVDTVQLGRSAERLALQRQAETNAILDDIDANMGR